MDFDEYIKCIRSSLKAPKVFLKRKTKDMRINLFNECILLAWKANLDIKIVLEPYGCASYIVGYISKSQRGMSAQLDAAAKEARKGNLDLKHKSSILEMFFSNCVEVNAQEAVYLDLQIPLTKCTRDIVFVNTSVPEERIFLLKPKAALDELPAESTDVESDNVIQRYSKRPKQLSKFCLADNDSKVDIIYPKGNKVPEKVNDKNDDDRCDRIKYRHLKVVIIDEISMVGNKMLSFIDTRLQQLTGSKAAFGGLSVIAVGDLYQLKPVNDFSICLDLKEGASSLARNLWKELFTMYELVDIMRQKDDLAFAQLLNRLRLNEMTEEDKRKLQTRVFDRDTGDYPKDAVHLFARNVYVKKHNDNILSQLQGEKFVIPCHDNVVSANIPAKECQRLINRLPDDYSNTGQLMKSLTVVVGMIVVHTANVDVEDGLSNGATGVVKQIDFRMEGTNRPSIIWVLFDDPRVGRTTREKYRKLYNSSINTDWTPVYDVQRTFIVNYKTYQRIQFPLTPASGKSVWKA